MCTGERVITIEGTVEAICAAEVVLSKRLRDYMERDMSNSANMAPGIGGGMVSQYILAFVMGFCTND